MSAMPDRITWTRRYGRWEGDCEGPGPEIELEVENARRQGHRGSRAWDVRVRAWDGALLVALHSECATGTLREGKALAESLIPVALETVRRLEEDHA